MSVQSQGNRANLRLWLVALAIIIFVWSGLEDHDVIGVTILGAGLASTLFGWKLASRFKSSTRPWLTIAAISGALIGALACLMTVALMVFKDLRHGHLFPDYPPKLILAMLERLPIWAIAGGLIGISIGLLLSVFSSRKQNKS